MDSDTLTKTDAYTFAAGWHQEQRRKGIHQEDFIQHPLRVAERLLEHGLSDNDLIATALLHDVLEDTACPAETIRSEFGDTVLNLVLEVTDDTKLLKSERKQRQVERAEYLSEKAGHVRLADKCDNLTSLIADPPLSWGWPRQRTYVAWAHRVVNRIPQPHPGLLSDFREIHTLAWRTVTGSGPSVSPG